ncbi:MAG: hypothetical protein ACRBCJ_03285 [Hyphomicrobiaceae bacterium]
MKWHRIPLTYIARLRRARRRAGIGPAIAAAALITLVAALAAIAGFKARKVEITSRPISFTISAEPSSAGRSTGRSTASPKLAPTAVIKTSTSSDDAHNFSKTNN